MSLIIFIFALAIFSIHIVMTKRKMSSHHKMEILLSYLFACIVGVECFLTFIAHIFYPEQIADIIGWGKALPCQFEIGIFNLTFSLLGFCAIFLRQRFWIAVLIGYTVWQWGSCWGYFLDYMVEQPMLNRQMPVYFFSDLVAPALLILTYLFYIKTEPNGVRWFSKLKNCLNKK